MKTTSDSTNLSMELERLVGCVEDLSRSLDAMIETTTTALAILGDLLASDATESSSETQRSLRLV